MTTKNQRLEMALAYLREHKEPVQVPFWCGYANVIPFCYHYRNDYNNSELHCINKDTGEIYWVVDYYFDNGQIIEFICTFGKSVKDAVANGYNLSMLRNFGGLKNV